MRDYDQAGCLGLHLWTVFRGHNANSPNDRSLYETRADSLRRRELLALGGTWDEGAYIAVDKVLEPLRPEVYSDDWARLCAKAKVSKPATLHGARHGSATRMLDAGIPVHLVAAWHGHDPADTLQTCAHVDKVGLESVGAALAL